MVIDLSDITCQLKDAPEFWCYTPCDSAKKPIDPVTGRACKDWPDLPYSLTEIALMGDKVKSIGLLAGPHSGGILVVDEDGDGCDKTFEHHYPGHTLLDLPPTIRWSSGRPNRRGSAYLVPSKYWDQIRTNRLKHKDKSNGKVEMLWQGCQAIVAGQHPNDKLGDQAVKPGCGDGRGFYAWEPGSAPGEVELAVAPDWLLRPLFKDLPKAPSTSNGFLSVNGHWAVTQLTTQNDPLYDLSRARDILTNYATAEDYGYEEWLDAGMVLHHIGQQCDQDGECFNLWNEWSARQTSYATPEKGSGLFGEQLCKAKWESFNADASNPKTFASMLVWAEEECGYQRPVKSAPAPLAVVTSKGDAEKQSPSEEIDFLIEHLYQLNIDGASWAEIQCARTILHRNYGIEKKELDSRILELFSEKHGLNTTSHNGQRKRRRGRRGSDPRRESTKQRVLVPGFLHRGRDAVMVAPGGAGKTTMAMMLTHLVATGGKPFDQEEHVNPDDTGRCLVIGTDGGEGADGQIDDAIDLLKSPCEQQWRDRLTIWTANQEQGETPWGFNLADLNDLVLELQEAQELGDPYRLIVIDSLKAVFDQAKLDFGIGPAGVVMRLMQAIAIRFDASVLWLHHTKEGRDNGAAGGNTNIVQIPFAIWFLERVSVPDYPDLVRVRFSKFRGVNGGRRTFDFCLDQEIGLVKVIDNALNNKKALMAEIWEHRDNGITAKDLHGVVPLSDGRVDNLCSELFTKDGWVIRSKKMLRPTTKGAMEIASIFPDKAGEVAAWKSSQKGVTP